jgi:hypothetical protein
MLIIYGSRLYGRIEDFCGTHISTRFVHLWYLPLFPTGSHLVLGQSDDGDGYRGIPIGLSFRSMIAGYLRVWGVFGLVGSMIGLFVAISGMVSGKGSRSDGVSDDLVNLIMSGFIFVVAAAMMAFAWGVIGRLSHSEKQKRVLYQMFTGIAADPAVLRDARNDVRAGLFQKIGERAQGLAQTGYRIAVNPMTHWAQIALDPTVNDAHFIGASFVLAQLEGSFLQGPAKAQMEMTAHAIWNRVLQIAPPNVEAS